MERTKSSTKNDENHAQHDWARQDNDFFSKAKPLHEDDEEDYDEFNEDGFDDHLTNESRPGMAPTLTTEQERVLCEQFEQALAEYDTDGDDDDDDDNDECDEEAHGLRPLEGDAQIEAALDDFLQERKDEIFFQGTNSVQKHRVGGSGYSALVGNKMVHSRDLPNALQEADDNNIQPIQVVLQTASEILAQPLHPPPPEEILIDGKSYFSERPRNPWDCESILSTYSNLDNNPVTIGAINRRRKKKKEAAIGIDEPEVVPQIFLSKKTGLPLGVLQSATGKADNWVVADNNTMMSVNKGEARKRDETAEEKKSRKEAIKEERRVARLQKKAMREVFESELRKRDELAAVDSVNGQAVFRIP
jgi:protein LTV1